MTCNHEGAIRYQKIYSPHGDREICDRCGLGNDGQAVLPDVFWPGHAYSSEHLCDDMGNPIPLTSRRQKAQVMKDLGVSEAGDRVNGGPAFGRSSWIDGTREARRKNFEEARPQIRESYRRYLNRAGR